MWMKPPHSDTQYIANLHVVGVIGLSSLCLSRHRRHRPRQGHPFGLQADCSLLLRLSVKEHMQEYPDRTARLRRLSPAHR